MVKHFFKGFLSKLMTSFPQSQDIAWARPCSSSRRKYDTTVVNMKSHEIEFPPRMKNSIVFICYLM